MGCCLEDKEPLLVHDFLPKGDAAIRPLPWVTWPIIAIGAAKRLAFLHQLNNLQSFKPSNIWSDSIYDAKILDFGLARKGSDADRSHAATQVIGSYFHVAPEDVATGHLYVKRDVYRSGMVLVELLIRMQAYEANHPTDQQILVE